MNKANKYVKSFIIISSFIFYAIFSLSFPAEIKSNINKLILSYEFPNFELTRTPDENKTPWIKINGIGLNIIDRKIILPQKKELIAIPPESKITYEIIYEDCRQLEFNKIFTQFGLIKNDIPINKFPSELIQLNNKGAIRYQYYQELLINPIFFHREQLMFCNKIKVLLKWDEQWLNYYRINIEEPIFEEIYRKAFINYEQGKNFRAKKRTFRFPLQYPFLQGTIYKIKVNADGIYRMDYQYLQNAGIPVDSLDPRTFQIFNKGSEISIYVSGEEDGKFDQNDYIEFYGEKMVPDSSRETEFEGADYTDDNVYWLSFGQQFGKRMQAKDVSPIHGYQSPDNFWHTEYINPYGFFYPQVWQEGMNHWVWAFEVKAPINQQCGSGEKDFNLQLPAIDLSSNEQAHIIIKLLARSGSEASSPDHHSIIDINNCINADSQYWDGRINFYHNFYVPVSCLSENSTIKLRLPGDVSNDYETCKDRIALDSIQIAYKRLFKAINDTIIFNYDLGNWLFFIENFQNNEISAYDITNKIEPIKLINYSIEPSAEGFSVFFEDSLNELRRYIFSSINSIKLPKEIKEDKISDLKNPNNSADYLIITDDTFINSDALSRFINLKEAKGFRTMKINIEDIYDEFSFGIFDPMAIKNFLEYVFNYWKPPLPQFVLLIGDPTFDFKNNRGSPDWFLFTPTLIGDNPYSPAGIFSSDSSLAAAVGDDYLPDFLIGRLSVHTKQDLRNVINKIIRYENLSPDQLWMNKIIMVADKPFWEPEWDFENAHNDAKNYYLSTPPWDVKKLYYRLYNDKDLFRRQIAESINNGTAILSFAGHGSYTQWGKEEYWNNNNAQQLLFNLDKYPLIYNVSCYTGGIHKDYKDPDPNKTTTFLDVLMEVFVNSENKGAIAGIAPSGSDDVLAVYTGILKFYDDIYSIANKDSLIGSIFYSLVLNYFKVGLNYEARGLILVGDPSVNLILPKSPQPNNLIAAPDNQKVILNWDAVPENIAGYNIYRCINHDPLSCQSPVSDFIKINQNLIQQTSYEDIGLTNGLTYYYRITAVNRNGFESKWSNMANATPSNTAAPSPPTGLAAVDPRTGGRIDLSWNANPENDILGYELYYGTTSQNYTNSLWVGNKLSYSLSGLQDYTVYYFALKAYNTSGLSSDFSAEVAAIPTRIGGSQPKRIKDLKVSKSTLENSYLQWSMPTENESGAPVVIIGYSVYRGEEPSFVPDHSNPGQINTNRIAAINDPNQTFYEDIGALTANKNYYYLVSAYDEDWMESSVSTDPPSSIYDLILIKQSPNILFQWSIISPQPNAWIVAYNLYKDNIKSFVPDRANHTNLYISLLAPPYIDSILLNDSNMYYFKILAVDNHGNESLP